LDPIFLMLAFNWEKDGIAHAEQVLTSLKEPPPILDDSPPPRHLLVKPDTAIYNAVLNCWAKNGSRSSAAAVVQRAEEILSEMQKEYYENGNPQVKPNCRTYTTIIDILAKSGEPNAPQRCLDILQEMEQQYIAGGDIYSKPNVFTYTAAINCFARSKDKQKAVQAVNILQRMEEQYRQGNDSARPNVIAYNSVLNACAYALSDADAAETAFKIACLVFDEIRTSCHVQPTHVTYGTFLRVCANLMPTSDVKDRLVEATFKRCAKEGLVSNMVWRNLKAAASPVLLNEFLEQANNGLEANWSRNV
jgi:PPR repeat.